MLRPRIFRGRPSNRVITSADLAETPSFWCTQLYLKCFKILDDAPPLLLLGQRKKGEPGESDKRGGSSNWTA